MLLLENAKEDVLYFRHYQWEESDAHTFGYSQEYAVVRESIPMGPLIRRPTGGGIVAHAHDWTYMLVIPSTHPMAASSARASYEFVHRDLAKTLIERGGTAELQACHPRDSSEIAADCFTQAESHDVISPGGQKLAGAAQKRNRNGLLIQGSISTQELKDIDWDAFER